MAKIYESVDRRTFFLSLILELICFVREHKDMFEKENDRQAKNKVERIRLSAYALHHRLTVFASK